MTFSVKYKDSDFLDTMDTGIPTKTTAIAKRVGCSRSCAILYLNKLLDAGKVKKVEIGGGFYAWVRVPTEEDVVVEREPTLLELVSEYSQKHPDDALAKKMCDALQKKLNPYTHSYQVDDHVVLLDPEAQEELKRTTGYTGEIVMRVTKCMQTMVWVESVSDLIKYAYSITTATPDMIRMATQEEIDIAKSYVIPEKYLEKMRKAAESDS